MLGGDSGSINEDAMSEDQDAFDAANEATGCDPEREAEVGKELALDPDFRMPSRRRRAYSSKREYKGGTW